MMRFRDVVGAVSRLTWPDRNSQRVPKSAHSLGSIERNDTAGEFVPLRAFDPEFSEIWIGSILHQVICGAFKANGSSLYGWCGKTGLEPRSVLDVIYGYTKTARGTANLERVIDAAGREFVRDAYARRLVEHAKQFTKGAA